jgi:hypothetical protein
MPPDIVAVPSTPWAAAVKATVPVIAAVLADEETAEVKMMLCPALRALADTVSVVDVGVVPVAAVLVELLVR